MTRWMAMRAGLTASALAALLASACSRAQEPAAPPATPAATPVQAPAPAVEEPLVPVVLPELTSVSDAVRTQIEARDAALRAVLARDTAPAAERAKFYGELGDILMAATFFDEARLCYRHAAAQEPDEARWPYLVGHAAVRAGAREAAAAAFSRMLALEPAYTPALVWLGEMQLDLGRADEAQATFTKALVQQSDSAAVLFGAGRAAVARGAYAEAVSYLEHALQLDPRASAIHYPLAMAYRRVGSAAQAEPLLQKRGSVAPAMADPLLESTEVLLDSAVALEGKGMQALRSQDWPGAIAAFRRGLEVEPDDPSLRYWLASALIASGDAAGAQREFREVVRRHPDYARAHFSLGAIAEQRGQRAEALREYQAAVQHAPNMPAARLRLADTLRTAGRMPEAFAQYDEAVRLDPSALGAWVGGAQALLAIGDTDQARNWLARAQKVHPASAPLAQLQNSLR